METTTPSPSPHSGNLISAVFRARRIHKNALSRVLGCNISTIVRLQHKPSVPSDRLWQLCHALKHNFFRDIADQLPPDFSLTAPPDGSKDRRIAELERQVQVLQAEKAVLLEAMRK